MMPPTMPDTITRREFAAQQSRDLPAHLAVAPYNDRYQTRLGSALTPQALTAALRMADQGYLYTLADVLDELRETDPHLQSECFKREAVIAGAEWELRPPEKSGRRGAKIADTITRQLRAIEGAGDMSLSFADLVAHLMSGVYNGRAVAEVVWSRDGRVPVALDYVHHRRLAYATDWRLHLWDATGGGPGPGGGMMTPAERAFAEFPGVPFDAFPRGKFVVHRPRVRGGYPTREGLGRTVCWFACFKKFDVRDWLAFAEWAGRGLRVGTFASGNDPAKPVRASKEDTDVLRDALEAMSSTVSVVIPDTTEIKIHDAPTNTRVHEELLRLCNAEMSKAILGATLTSDGGSTGGNRALGEVHERVALLIARSDAASLAATLRRDLIGPMVRRMFGDRAPVPEIVFAVDPAENMDALAKRIQIAVSMGVAIGQRDVRNLLSLPDPAADDVLVTGAPSSAQTIAPKADDASDDREDHETIEEPEHETDDENEADE